MSDKNQDVILPSRENDKELANSFLDYFTKKIENIRSQFPDSPVNYSSYVGNKMSSFQCVTADEIYQLVVSFGVKCSPEDPIPANLLKKNIDLFVPIWTKLVNISLLEGSMNCLKNAVLIPLVKELDNYVDEENKKNYRPVSNLLFVGKLVERIVSIQLNQHTINNNLRNLAKKGSFHGNTPAEIDG